jgi:hypothetical protein
VGDIVGNWGNRTIGIPWGVSSNACARSIIDVGNLLPKARNGQELTMQGRRRACGPPLPILGEGGGRGFFN